MYLSTQRGLWLEENKSRAVNQNTPTFWDEQKAPW